MEKIRYDFDFWGLNTYTRKRVKHSRFIPYIRWRELKNPNGGIVPPAPYGGGGGGMGSFRTFELFGIMNGMTVPLSQVVSCDRVTGVCTVTPGGRVIVGEQPNEGFGLAGSPGRWQMYYGGRSPAEFGLDADKGVLGSDGSRGWVLDARFLSQIFGSGWRMAVYS